MQQIKIKHKILFGIQSKNRYIIVLDKIQIGEISFIKRNHILIIGFLKIYSKYRNNGYGYKTIEYLLSHYKINCIVGQTLQESKTFWNKCVKKFNGERRNVHTLENCSSSFVIPKYNIPNNELCKMLDLGHEIE